MKKRLSVHSKVKKTTIQFSELSKREQARVEAAYHRMKPDQLNEVMTKARRSTD